MAPSEKNGLLHEFYIFVNSRSEICEKVHVDCETELQLQNSETIKLLLVQCIFRLFANVGILLLEFSLHLLIFVQNSHLFSKIFVSNFEKELPIKMQLFL